MNPTTTVYSIYFSNISDEVVKKQHDVISKFLPQDYLFIQYLHKPKKTEVFQHATALEHCVKTCNTEYICLLDIDCIPLTKDALPSLIFQVNRRAGRGLVGCVQRANHIQNNKHVYVGPFCMAFAKKYYTELGSPSFAETNRGDVGEELTYKWTEADKFMPAYLNEHRYSENINFILPIACLQPMWDLDYNVKFGLGTTYGYQGKPLFYHAFNARDEKMQKVFIAECDKVLGTLQQKSA